MTLPIDTKKILNVKKSNDIIEIVKGISQSSKIWVVGGLVYRNIVNQMYAVDENKELFDFDFIVEKIPPFDKINIPFGWKLTKTGLGDIRLIKKNNQMDIFPLDNAALTSDWHKTKDMNTIQKLESYFKRVPLTVQAVAYDVSEQKVFGDIGLRAIEDKKIEINKERMDVSCPRVSSHIVHVSL